MVKFIRLNLGLIKYLMGSVMNLEANDKDENSILNALKEAYGEKKAYDKVHMSDIIRHSGVAIGKIYANFTDKDDIAIGLIKKSIYNVFITFDEEIELKMPLGDKLKVFLSLQLEFIGPHLNLIKELLPKALIPFSNFNGFISDTRTRYLDFISELFLNNVNKNNFLFRAVTLPVITNSFLLFNLSVLQFWSKDNSEGKQSTLNFIEKGIKNIMITTVLL